MALRRGGVLFLEFSAATEHEELGSGEDLFDLPDPAICRMRVAWPGPGRDHRNPRERTTA
ncbi:MAG: hypothetical protein JWM84_1505 [Nocardioides sp.]|nr:hypothetical protein [Nocardioides sp.]